MNECWNWEGTKNKAGYGYTKTQKLVHRVMCEMVTPHFDKSLCVLHKCDNPSCVRPSHLYQGTHKDNARDRQVRGRNRGAFQPCHLHRNARFTEKQVAQIRKQLALGKTITQIAKSMGCKVSTIFHIQHGKTWRHLFANAVDGLAVLEKISMKVHNQH